MRHLREVPLGRTAIVAQALIGLGFLFFLLQNQGYLPLQRYEYKAVFSSSLGLKGDFEQPVAIRGLDVGKVTDVRVDDGRAVATLTVTDPLARDLLRADARATVAYRSAFANLAVELDPGRAREPLAEGAVIPERRTAGPVAPDQVVRTLDADTRAYLAVLLGELRLGTDDRATPLRASLSELGRASEPGARVAEALADRRRTLSRLVGELDTVFAALGERRDSLGDAVRAGEATLSATGRREAELAASLRGLPGTLAALDAALGETEELAGPLEPALTRLRPVARRLPTSLRALRGAVPEGRALLTDLAPLVPEARPIVARTRRVAERLGPASRRVAPATADLRRVLEPIARRRRGLRSLGENASGALSTNDRNGPLLRSVQFFEPFDPGAFGAPGARGSRLARLRSQVSGALLERCQGGDAAACLIPALTPGLGAGPLGAKRPPRLEPPMGLRPEKGERANGWRR